MNIKDFKQELINKTLSNDLVIFICPNKNTFLAEMYTDEICEQNNFSKNYIMTLRETTESALSLVIDFSSDLNILKNDIFSEQADDYSAFKNCIVICNKVDKSILEKVKNYIIEIPELVDWQISAYIQSICSGITPEDADFIVKILNKNIFKISSFAKQISLFEDDLQHEKVYELLEDLDETSHVEVFKVIDAMLNKDKKFLSNFLKHDLKYSAAEVDPIGLTTLTLTKLKNILMLNYKSGVDEQLLGLSSKNIMYIKNNSRNISLDRIVKMINFLSNINSRLRANPSNLDFTNNKKSALLEYIVLGVMSF